MTDYNVAPPVGEHSSANGWDPVPKTHGKSEWFAQSDPSVKNQINDIWAMVGGKKVEWHRSPDTHGQNVGLYIDGKAFSEADPASQAVARTTLNNLMPEMKGYDLPADILPPAAAPKAAAISPAGPTAPARGTRNVTSLRGTTIPSPQGQSAQPQSTMSDEQFMAAQLKKAAGPCSGVRSSGGNLTAVLDNKARMIAKGCPIP
jgi:hypothetical protein